MAVTGCNWLQRVLLELLGNSRGEKVHPKSRDYMLRSGLGEQQLTKKPTPNTSY